MTTIEHTPPRSPGAWRESQRPFSGGGGSSPSPIRFSIILVHRNGEELLKETLHTVHAALDPLKDELFLVDNGSSDHSIAMVRHHFPLARILANGCNQGFARANNQAIRLARGRYLLLLNNDTRIPPDLLHRLEERMQMFPGAGIIGGQLVGPDGSYQRSSRCLPTPWDELGLGALRGYWQPPPPQVTVQEVEAIIGACMAVRLDAIRNTGLMDEDFFFYFEELEWCHRMRRHGWSVLVDNHLQITHLRGASTRPVYRGAQLEMFRSRLLFYRKVFPPYIAIPLLLFRLGRLVVNAVAGTLLVAATLGLWTKPRQRAGMYLHQLGWLLCGWPDHWGLPDKCPRKAPALPPATNRS